MITLHEYVHNRLSGLGLDCSIQDEEVHINRQPRVVKIRFDQEWREAYRSYRQARSINFDNESRILRHNNSVEFYLQRLSTASFGSLDPYTLQDGTGNTVEIGQSSHAFKFSIFESDEYEKYFHSLLKTRLLERNIFLRRMDQLIWNPTTAIYKHKGRKTPENIREIALRAVNSSLLKIAVDFSEPFVIWTKRNRTNFSPKTQRTDSTNTIPKANYEKNVVNYHKVAKASPFPSQSFLAYYHVMEYYFLMISETLLQARLTVALNDPNFIANRGGADKLISIVRGQDARSDETEMLRSVLDQFVPEDELIDLIESTETSCGERIYSKERTLFGEKITISPKKGHVVSNSAKALKHIRNAIVHSSDRYKREDCHIPLSETEDAIADFIPLVKFCAEKVIFGTAT